MTVETKAASKASSGEDIFYAPGRDSADLYHICCDECGTLAICSKYHRELKKRTLCPRCYPAVSSNSVFWLYLSLLGGAAIWALPLGDRATGYPFFLIFNVALCILFVHLLILPHELLHAISARLLRGEVFAIFVGIGPPLWQGKWRGVTLSLRRYLIMGLCFFAFADKNRSRLRYGLAVAAPLVGHLLLAIWLWPQLRWGGVPWGWSWREMLMVANGFLLVINLYPFHVDGSALGTDGLKLLSLATGKLDIDELHTNSFFVRIAAKTEAEEIEAALALNEEGLALYPEHALLRSNWLALTVMAERFEAGLPGLLDKIEHPEPEPYLHAQDLNNAAWGIFRLHQMGKLAESSYSLAQALSYAKWAYAMIPWHPSLQGTYAAMLLETGETDQAIWHAQQAAEAHESPRYRATNLALAAVGYHRRGDGEQAQRLLTQAETLAAEDVQIQWAKKQLSK